ncbi:GDSL esterase/lipase At5g03610-like [Punica granatum]|uniref:GDSL esterase/lipase At5g03610-like n=1 Tax=Punica granatum TaxID=22663 RepID=A0A6P8CMI8_PUNGR|nr:GDSL esterase/lipase At5g03610-like [Punica granatum]
MRPTKLFVFGDSYADTGNKNITEGRAWKFPYGISFPGRPTGRFSDGILLTDYIARFLMLKTPVTYHWSKFGSRYLNSRIGMNFAYGGTGVYNTSDNDPNMTDQINFFEQQIKDHLYSPADLNSSLALVTLSGNDYSNFQEKNPDGDILGFQFNLTNQLKADLKRIHDLGVKKVAVATLQPVGCLPTVTVSNDYKKCNDSIEMLVSFHNYYVTTAVADLNNQTNSNSSFVVLDLHNGFMSVLTNGTGFPKFEDPMKPCCMGVSSEYNCGDMDKNGTRLYTMCRNPREYFFWDSVHPTQAGWRAVYTTMLPILRKILFF